MKKHIVITGKVQNVGYRYWLYKEAIKKNISGWVRNKISGEVEVLVIGNDTDINNLIKLCKNGPPLSKVTKIEVQNYPKEFLKKSFNIIGNGN
jgi:acylphosphatase